MSDPYLGEIRMVGFNFAPVGWALCQGQIMSIAQNNALFALLGTTFGGTGTTTFGLPDFRSRSPVGTGQGPGLSSIEWGEVSGNESTTLLQTQMPIHTHVATASGGGTGNVQISVPATTTTTNTTATPGPTTVLAPGSSGGHAATIYSTAAANTTLLPFSAPVTTTPPTIVNQLAGGSQPVGLRNPFLGTTFIIALQGIYPTRP
ncbi:phage tail protein [Paraburkholderia bryophila]|uniref:Microcystin-dependent protein n=1 Tax=Paraburkholderia bryophila TaxID=420952 RepID=A0A329BNL1_9BURK|nr:tail fiber protein [Paraburkholderia bryophila]RAS23467.1 microcystin-dependent protein [Paraburkholderia bryophila]